MRQIDVEAERKFENEKVAGDNPRAAQSKFYWATAPKTAAFEERISRTIAGGHVLEIGCTHGALSLGLAEHAGHVTGIDISDEGIAKARATAAAAGVKNTTFVCGDAHKLPFEDNSFDACVAISVLHHLDFETAVSEIRRVVKPGGVLLSREPLGTNPMFQLYRAMTPKARTDDERPLNRADMAVLERAFDLSGTQVFGLTSVLAGLIKPLPGSGVIRSILLGLDDLLQKTGARWLFWQITIVGTVRQNQALGQGLGQK